MNIHIKPSTRRFIERFVAEEIATLDASTPADPFGIDHDCRNPAGHFAIRVHRETVCAHCSKVLWS